MYIYVRVCVYTYVYRWYTLTEHPAVSWLVACRWIYECVCVFVCMSHTHNHLDVLACDSARYTFFWFPHTSDETHSLLWNSLTSMKFTHVRSDFLTFRRDEIHSLSKKSMTFEWNFNYCRWNSIIPDECQALQMKFTHGGWNPLTWDEIRTCFHSMKFTVFW